MLLKLQVKELSNHLPFEHAFFVLDSGTSTACIPRATPQSLATLGKVTFPSCIFVKKCGGCCGAARHCVSDATKNKLVTVFELSGGKLYISVPI